MGGKKTHAVILQGIHVLGLIDEEVLVARLQGGKKVRVGLEGFLRQGEHVVKVQTVIGPLPRRVQSVQALKLFRLQAAAEALQGSISGRRQVPGQEVKGLRIRIGKEAQGGRTFPDEEVLVLSA